MGFNSTSLEITMRTLTTYTYLIHEDGSYMLNSNGDRIVLDTDGAMEYDNNYSGIAGSIARFPHLMSFDVLWSASMSEWRLFVNKQQLVGRYGSRPQALGVLVGMFRQLGANDDERVAEVMSHLLSTTDSTIEDDQSFLPVSTAYYSYGKAPTNGLNPFYYSNAADVASGRTPDLGMQPVIDQMNGGNANLVMIYPDSGANGTVSTTDDRIWDHFNMDDIGEPGDDNYKPGWDGVSPTPQMIPAEYVASVQYFLDEGLIETTSGKAFCFDWEGEALTTQALGSIFWNDAEAPKYKAALIELRAQQLLIYNACKAAFPEAHFGMYGGTVNVPQAKLKWDIPSSSFKASGKTSIRWFALCDTLQASVLTVNFRDAIDGTESPWDYVTKVCYDAFAPDSTQAFIDTDSEGDATRLKPWYVKELNDWALGLMKAELPEVPALAIISPSNIAVFDLGTSFNDLDPYAWATPKVWIDQTIKFITAADGYLIWDSLRVDQTRQFMVNYNDWQDILDRDIANGDNKIENQMNKWFNMLEDLERKFNVLTQFANNYSIPVPADAEDWFNLDRATIRGTDYTRNLISADIVDALDTTLIPLIEEWRTTGNVPFYQVSPPAMTGDAVVGGTLSVVLDYAGPVDTTTYQWKYRGISGSQGSQSTLVVGEAAQDTEVTCRVRQLIDGEEVTNVLLTSNTVPVVQPAGAISVLAPTVFSTVSLSETGWDVLNTGAFNASNANNAQVGVGLSINMTGVGSQLRPDMVAGQSVFTFSMSGPGGSTSVTCPLATIVDGIVLEFTDATLTSALVSGSYTVLDSISYTNP